MNWFNPFLFACVIIFLFLAGLNVVYGAAQAPKSAAGKNNGDLIALPSETEKGAKSSNTSKPAAKSVSYRDEDELSGVIYDFTRTANRKKTDLMEPQTPDSGDFKVLPLLKKFISGGWEHKTDAKGTWFYPELNQLCRSSKIRNKSYFYQAPVSSDQVMKTFFNEEEIPNAGWCSIHSGYIVAPFTGKMRFVGFGDDALVVRFNQQVVFDYGLYALTLGQQTDPDALREAPAIIPKNTQINRFLSESKGLYSTKLDTYFSNLFNNHGVAKGLPVSVTKGKVYQIEILYSNLTENASVALFVEQLDSNNEPLISNPKRLSLFRTSSELPGHPANNAFPDYDDESPVWRIVDSKGKPIRVIGPAKQNETVKTEATAAETGSAVQKKATAVETVAPKTTSTVSVKKYEDELAGVFYDLKQTADGEQTGLLEIQSGKQFNLNRMRTMAYVWNLPETSGKESVMVPYLKRFVVSNWPSRTDSSGALTFNEFKQFSRSPVNPLKSYIYQPLVSSESAPKTVSGDPNISDAGWIEINSGYVVAPFTGKFRFVGYGNDALVVRFDNQIVLDYGVYALSLGKKLDDTWDYKLILSGAAAKTDPLERMVLNNPVYSRCKLDTYFSSLFDEHGLAKGVPISVTRGKHYPIQILVADIEQDQFGAALFVEPLDSSGAPLTNNLEKLSLFRTSSALPAHSSGSAFPDFDESGPIWRVVDSKGKQIPHKPTAAEMAQKKDPAEENVDGRIIVVIEGIIDGEDAFVFRDDKVFLEHKSFDMPNSITVNGKPWTDLSNPFELGFTPDPASTQLICEGRGQQKMTRTNDSITISVYDQESGAEHYRLSLLQQSGTTPEVKQSSNPPLQRDPNLKKTVTRTTSGNVTTETITEYDGDTTIETVTTTETKDNTTVQTTVVTETKNGVVVRKSSSTSTTNVTTTKSTSSTSQASGTDKKNTSEKTKPAETGTGSEKKDKPAYNPFGYTSPLTDD